MRLSRILVCGLGVATIGLVASVSPAVSHAAGCGGWQPACGQQKPTEVAIETLAGAAPREGLVLKVVTHCPIWDVSQVKLTVRASDGKVVPGVVSVLTTPTPYFTTLVKPEEHWVVLWRPSTPLLPSASYSLEITQYDGSSTSMSFTTAESLLPLGAAPSPETSLAARAAGVETYCCVECYGAHADLDGKTRTCVDAVTTPARELLVSVPVSPFVRHRIYDTQRLEPLAVLDGWAAPPPLPLRFPLADSSAHCVYVEAELVLTGEKTKSQPVCPSPISLETTTTTHCQAIADLAASCVGGTKELASGASAFLQKQCGPGNTTGTGGSGGAGDPMPASVRPAKGGGCSVSLGSASTPWQVAAWLALSCAVAARRRRRAGPGM